MKILQFFDSKRRKIAQLLDKGAGEEAQNNLEAAYELYNQASELGSGKAMAAIGSLYAVKGFRMVERTNIADLIRQGIPVFPWNVIRETVPDHKAALEWFCKAAEQGEPAGYAAAGAMLCEGIGGPVDLKKGLAYLNKALDLGIEEVRPAIAVYAQAEDICVSDEKYEKLLQEFVCAVDAQKPEQHALYYALKGGSDRQKARLGYTLVTRRNVLDPKYADFKYLFSSDGLPLIPCCARRLDWKTFVRIDLNALPSDDVLITFASDISYNLSRFGRLKQAGTVVYRSPDFGWLNEEKEAVVFRIDRQHYPEPEEMERFAEENHLQPNEYAPDNVAFILENGEKEYSVEIGAIVDGKIQILFRYTIGGPDAIRDSFEPALIKLDLDQN